MGNTPAMQMQFVWAAYALTFVLTALVVAHSFAAMRRAERRAENLRKERR